jgi:hypothetical protein
LDMNKVIQPAGREGGRLMHTMVWGMQREEKYVVGYKITIRAAGMEHCV